MATKAVFEYAEFPAAERAAAERQGWRITGMSKFRETVTYRMKREVLAASPVVRRAA